MAEMSFLVPVNGRHLWFSTYPVIRQYCHLSLRVALTRPQKHGCNRWNFSSNVVNKLRLRYFRFERPHFGYHTSFRSYNNTNSPIGLLDLENPVIAVGISFLSCPQAEIEVYPVLEATILYFPFPVKSNHRRRLHRGCGAEAPVLFWSQGLG